MYKQDTKIQYVKKIGPVKAVALNKAGIYTVLDLLETIPNSYIYPGKVSIRDARQGYVIIKAEIRDIYRLPNRPIVIAQLNDGTGICKAIWYHQKFVANNLGVGTTATFWGQFKNDVLHQPRFTTYQFKPDEVCGGNYGVLTSIVRPALKEVLTNVELPNLSGELSLTEVFKTFHFPENKHKQQEALKTLKFNELLLMQLAIMLRKKKQEQTKGMVIKI